MEAYFTNYERLVDYWYFVPAWLDGCEVLVVDRRRTDPRPTYFVELTHVGEQITGIRDFHFVPYVAAEASITPSHTNKEGGGGN